MLIKLTPQDFHGLAALGVTLSIETDAESVTWTFPEGEPLETRQEKN